MTVMPHDDDDQPAPPEQGQPGKDMAGRLDRIRKALRLRRLGNSWEAIAIDMGYADGAGPRQLVLRYLEAEVAEGARMLREIENQRLDVGVQALMTIITDRSLTPEQRIRATEALTRNSARRARLNGLDAPLQVAVDGGALAELDDAFTLLREVVTGEVISNVDDTGEGEAGAGHAGEFGSPSSDSDDGG